MKKIIIMFMVLLLILIPFVSAITFLEWIKGTFTAGAIINDQFCNKCSSNMAVINNDKILCENKGYTCSISGNCLSCTLGDVTTCSEAGGTCKAYDCPNGYKEIEGWCAVSYDVCCEYTGEVTIPEICTSPLGDEGDYQCVGGIIERCSNGDWDFYESCESGECLYEDVLRTSSSGLCLSKDVTEQDCPTFNLKHGESKCEGATKIKCNDGKIVIIGDCLLNNGESCTSHSICRSGYCNPDTLKCDIEPEPPEPIKECPTSQVCCKKTFWNGQEQQIDFVCMNDCSLFYIGFGKKCSGTEPTTDKKDCWKCEDSKVVVDSKVLTTEDCPQGTFEEKPTCHENITSIFEPTQLSLTEKDLREATSATIIRAICKIDENCIPYEDLQGNIDYVVKCRSTALLKQEMDEAVKKECKVENLGKFILGSSLVTGGLCISGIALNFIPGATLTGIPAVLAGWSCVASITSATAIGGIGFAYEAGCEMHQQGLGDGLCIATKQGEEPSPIVKDCPDFVKDIGKMFGADKYVCLIGWIATIIGLIIALVIIFKLLEIFT